MNKILFVIVTCVLSGVMTAHVFAAELLDVKPMVSGSTVSVDITADVAMTYTYYKVPGQLRAVVDIAEADPEKVEPLIVVNKGVVSSISVDKAEISGMVVSRIIFNLVAESNISVSSAPDRKMLTVSFGSLTSADKGEVKPEQTATAPIIPPATQSGEAAAITPDTAGEKTSLDDLESVPTAVEAASIPATPSVTRVPKLEPVVPINFAAAEPAPLTIHEVITGAASVEIRANQSLADFKSFRLAKPERLVIDIPAVQVAQKAKTISINKFGIAKARIGVSPRSIRIVLDASASGFPHHTITATDNGLKITFK